MSDKDIQDHLGLDSGSTGGPVECLGQEFESDAARREHYLELLAEKLKDPEFRNIEGFPLSSSDDDILNLSDPPFYTACPNPWINEFVEKYGNPSESKDTYHREPFAADVSEGKNHPIYRAHSYHTKVPHRAIMRYILHYTEPGDIVFDGFCGTGMTGVAAQLCGDRKEVEELGYKVDSKGLIWDQSGNKISALGERKAILNDLSPAATYISYSYNLPTSSNSQFEKHMSILDELESEFQWMYETRAPSGEIGKINYTVWSDVFLCPECGSDVNFWEVAVNKSTWKVSDSFNCPSCSAALSKRKLERKWAMDIDPKSGTTKRMAQQAPVLINYKIGNRTNTKAPDEGDIKLLEKSKQVSVEHWYPTEELPRGFNTSQPAHSHGITKVYEFYTPRALACLAAYAEKVGSKRFLSHLTSSLLVLSKLYRFRSQGGSLGAGGGPMNGTLYVPSLIKEIPVLKVLRQHVVRSMNPTASIRQNVSLLGTGSFTDFSSMPDNSMDYLFLDPPFGANINYSELNFIWESWLQVWTNNKEEAIENSYQEKGAPEYRSLMAKSFAEAYRVLKPGRWVTVEFSNTKASVWNSIQTALTESGFVIANVSALDKKQGSFKAVTTPTAVKQDLVISAYKPHGQLELDFARNYGKIQSAWDFIDYHLARLPISKPRGGHLEYIAERDPRILYDRTVAYFVAHETPVPISSFEFQEELLERYAERDGMIFLGEQVATYDSARSKLQDVGQLSIFVEDEKSALNWLRSFLKKRPSVYNDIQPEFLKQLGISWKKWEDQDKLADLGFLLNQAFIQYKGEGPVPSQIHNYLSTQFKNLRKLDKEDPALKSKAKDRWYVPDPSKQKDMDELRERRLLEEFWSYLPPNYVPPALSASSGGEDLPGLKFQIPKIPKGKKMKELRTEAIRAGFRFCYQKKDYQTMLVAAQIVPDAVIEEDEQLQLLYDTAVTRSGVED